VDDVVQETFITMSKKAETFEPGTNFTAWICSIARYKAMEMRKATRLPFETLSDSVLNTLHAMEPATDDFEKRVVYFEECLGKLAPQARRAMEMRYRDALLPVAISRKMSWSVGAVKVSLSRARTLLRDCVAARLMVDEVNPGAKPV
ncbi:MAG TPA: sigma-70 family RNA polymerase sigma factor, partial [Luteolibacter sp.]|nr:sigma-70 family RNA polymerase sigma factor [Luteolibacter sp.]